MAAAAPPRSLLVVAILASTMAFLDGTAVNVALPVMQRQLGATAAEMQWVVEAYALFLAALVLVGGALGDRYGRKRVFLAGVVLFGSASAACGLAPGATLLVVARGVQGIGAALLVPGSLALLTAGYPDEGERGAAIGKWSSASAITSAIGPVFGGWLVMRASWRWVFFLNLPLAALVVALSIKGVVETRDDEDQGKLDVLGALVAVLGLGAVVYALLESPGAGGLSRPRVLAPLALGAVALVAFPLIEARVAAPMVPLSLFRSRAFSVTNLLTLLLYAALGGTFFFLPFDLVQIQHDSPAVAGAALLPLVVFIALLSPWAGRLVARRGARLPLMTGPLIASGGFLLLAVPGIGGSYWTTFFPGIVALGLGMSITIAPLTMVVMGAVEPRHAGTASGLNNAVSRAAGLLAVAALGVVFVERFDGALDRTVSAMALSPATRAIVAEQRSRLAGANLDGVDAAIRQGLRRAFDEAFVSAFRATAVICAVLAALAGLSALAIEKDAHRPPPG
jgi:EmrB/QacA subfamily drug resistance transporter